MRDALNVRGAPMAKYSRLLNTDRADCAAEAAAHEGTIMEASAGEAIGEAVFLCAVHRPHP